jgi:murein DD-endopeptidase MepM/ murein hydrolase activator NlpD
MLYAHLAATSRIVRGQQLPNGAVLGYVGATGARRVHLHLELRRVREGIELETIQANRLIRGDVTIVCDPRNLLPKADVAPQQVAHQGAPKARTAT